MGRNHISAIQKRACWFNPFGPPSIYESVGNARESRNYNSLFQSNPTGFKPESPVKLHSSIKEPRDESPTR